MIISKLQVFKGETKSENPCILMHVSEQGTYPMEMERRDGAKNMVRVHTMRAML
jgi:hypothetical protein